jgi:hypothetical protein
MQTPYDDDAVCRDLVKFIMLIDANYSLKLFGNQENYVLNL